MTRFQYERRKAWAIMWLYVLGVWQWIYMPKNIKGAYAWVIAQCGFVYAGPWEMAKDMDTLPRSRRATSKTQPDQL